MAVQIYHKTFWDSGDRYDCKEDIREKALNEVNQFFFNHDCYDIMSIIEDWSLKEDSLRLTVYYKDYI